MGEIVLKDIEKSFETVSVLRAIDLETKDGEFVVFVGPSGCGKSTLRRMITGLEEVTAGRGPIANGPGRSGRRAAGRADERTPDPGRPARACRPFP